MHARRRRRQRVWRAGCAPTKPSSGSIVMSAQSIRSPGRWESCPCARATAFYAPNISIRSACQRALWAGAIRREDIRSRVWASRCCAPARGAIWSGRASPRARSCASPSATAPRSPSQGRGRATALSGPETCMRAERGVAWRRRTSSKETPCLASSALKLRASRPHACGEARRNTAAAVTPRQETGERGATSLDRASCREGGAASPRAPARAQPRPRTARRCPRAAPRGPACPRARPPPATARGRRPGPPPRRARGRARGPPRGRRAPPGGGQSPRRTPRRRAPASGRRRSPARGGGENDRGAGAGR